MKKYPVGPGLEKAITALFDDPSIGLGFLGRGVGFLPVSSRGSPSGPDMNGAERAIRLREKLESYVIQMAEEAVELGGEETPRLRAEATATLVILRELQNHFPEAFIE